MNQDNTAMDKQGNENTTKLLRGMVAGLIAGEVASYAMDRFQAAVSAVSSSPESGEEEEPLTEKAADGAAKTLTGSEVPAAAKPLAGQAVHYLVGIDLGIAYGIAAEFQPVVTTGAGTAFGVVTATLLDETVVPAVRLSPAPWTAGAKSHVYSYASHLAFGTAAELVRSQVAKTLKP